MIQIAYISLLVFAVVNFFSPTLKSITVIATISFWLFGLIGKKQSLGNPQSKILNYLALILLFWGLITNIVYEKSLLNILTNSLFGEYMFWLAISSLIFHSTEEYLERLKFFMVSGSLLTSFYIILQVIGIIPQHNSGVMGILNQPFTSSGLLIISVFITLDLQHYFQTKFPNLKNNISRIVYLLVVFEIVAIVILGQVTTWASLLIALVFYFVQTKALNLKKLCLAILVLVSVVFLAQISSPRIARKLKWFTSVERLTTNKSISCRYGIWKQNLEALKSSPYLGLGKVIKFNCKIKNENTKLTHMHNIFLQKLVEGGVLKFTIWFLFYIYMFLTLIKNNKGTLDYLPMLCILIALSLEGLLENWWGDSEVVQLMLLSLAMYTSSVKIK